MVKKIISFSFASALILSGCGTTSERIENNQIQTLENKIADLNKANKDKTLEIQNLEKKLNECSKKNQPAKESIAERPSCDLSNNAWCKAKNLSLLNFDYPCGWHVMSSWPYEPNIPFRIFIDPLPINTAPRGVRSLGVITISEYRLEINDENFLKNNLEKSKKEYPGLTESSFPTESATIYKLEGITNFMGADSPVVEYHAIFKDSTTDDSNIVIIKAELTTFGINEKTDEYKKIIERIVTSMHLWTN